MHRLFTLFIPGSHLYKQRKMILGDILNVLATISILTGTYLYYSLQIMESIYPFAFVLFAIVFNMVKLKQIEEKVNNPTYIKLQEIEFREILNNFLIGNQDATLKSLKRMLSQQPCPQEIEIFMLYMLNRQNQSHEAKKISEFLKQQNLTASANSLFHSISK